MKTLSGIIRLLIFSFLILACSHNSKLQRGQFQSREIVNRTTEEMLNHYQNAIYLEGDFQLERLEKDQWSISTGTEDLRHTFLISGFDSPADINMEINSVYYLENGLLLNNNLFLGVEGNIDSRLQKDLEHLTSMNNSIRHHKIGKLVHLWSPGDDPDFKQPTPQELRARINRIDGHDGDCEQGGEGATSCSVTSSTGSGCSVSCGSGYYACCNETAFGPNDCHCHSDTDQNVID
ncbi:hypothetical protein GWK08_13535 [Leptobacterium flavescens]|uniref:Lipoprotein n=1 Tax=Leptobacterium flavescens TaxID=472055 RepID=A0A6P0UPS1_9FLAO|nr:hypothetical protein [Leptobacterium flavescens]NER14470.1 hypothetical protein [Leptobacterium flavescens]